jgi:hypothetical protein
MTLLVFGTRDLLACSIVPQSTMLPRAPPRWIIYRNSNDRRTSSSTIWRVGCGGRGAIDVCRQDPPDLKESIIFLFRTCVSQDMSRETAERATVPGRSRGVLHCPSLEFTHVSRLFWRHTTLDRHSYTWLDLYQRPTPTSLVVYNVTRDTSSYWAST